MSRQPKQSDKPKRRIRFRRLSLEALECREMLTGFTVTTALDNGNNVSPTPNSLRAAIIAANADPTVGADSISFAIPGPGTQTIALQSALPAITRTVVIDGTTQSMGTATPVVVLDGSAAGLGANGLTFSAGSSSVVRDLAIVGNTATAAGVGGNAILVEGTATQTVIEGNYIGIGADGVTAKSNSNGIVIASANNTVGGTTASARNVVANSTFTGILIIGSGASGNLVAGNYVGTDASGDVAAGNQVGIGLKSPNNTVGGTTAGAANVISGNVGPTAQNGIGILLGGQATGELIEGNKIGTNAAGTGVLQGTQGNFQNIYGIYFGTPGALPNTEQVKLDTIGGTVAGAGNLISGNFIGITGNTLATLIAGNTIGLDVTGLTPLPNGDGIILGASGSTIGGTVAAARNVVSGNFITGAAGVGIDLTGDSDVVQGNYIGVTAAGLGASGVGNVVGLALNTSNSTIGGTVAGSGNVIAGNSGDGVLLGGLAGNLFQGNLIGEAVGGAALGNGGDGINISIPAPTSAPTTPLALNDTIGGSVAGAGNLIANSGGSGIVVNGNYPTGFTGLTIRENIIAANGKLGIDLNGTGVPIPSSVYITGTGVVNGLLSVFGVLSGAASTTYAIDLFANGNDPSGFGQGPIFLGTQTVTTNSSGFATFNPSFANPATPYTSFTATATGPDGSTTEFTANYPKVLSGPQADLSVTNSAASGTVVVNNSVTLVETITNSGPNAASGVVLTDSLPTSFVNAQIQSTIGTLTLDSNNVLTVNVGTLLSGQTVTVTIVAIASAAGTFADSPGVGSTTFDPNYLNNQTTQTITVTPSGASPSADLAITQVASPTSGTVGANLTYVVTVSNLGPNTSTNATVNDFLPSGVKLVSATSSQGAQATVNGTLVTDNLGTIAAGASATLTIVVKPTAAGSIVNAANVSGNQPDPVSSNNSSSLTTTVVAATPKINFILAQSIFPQVGRIGTYQIYTMTVTNFGPDAAPDATLIDSLPANVTFINAAPSQGGYASLVNGVITENFGTIAAGASATLTLVVVPNTYGVFVNFAGVYTPDVPTATPSFSYGAVSVPSGPSVIGVAGSGGNNKLAVYFDGALNTSTATNKANYKLTALGTAGKGPNKAVTIASVTYNSATQSVLITPSKPLDGTQFYQLVVVGSTSTGIADTLGRRLVNPQYTAPGANFTVIFHAGALPQV